MIYSDELEIIWNEYNNNNNNKMILLKKKLKSVEYFR